MTDGLGIVEPVVTVETESLLEELKKLTRKHEIKGIVLGFPLTLKGKKGQRAKFVLKYKKKIKDALGLKVELFDERYTTREAKRLARELGKSKDREFLDRLSAVIILRGFLEEN